MYRIRHAAHHRTGDKWCIYPMYDFAHALSDSDRGHHPLALHAGVREPSPALRLVPGAARACYHPRQIEFARLNLTYTVMSKRKLLQLVEEGLVNGWDDPRMPTLRGVRRRGYTPEAIRDFCRPRRRRQERTAPSTSPLLEHCVREDLNQQRTARDGGAATRSSVVIDNYPEGQAEEIDAVNNPEDAAAGTRKVPFAACSTSSATTSARSRRPSTSGCRPAARCGCATPTSSPAPTSSRTRAATSSSCAAPTTLPPAAATRPTAARSKATLHWVSAAHAVDAEVRLYDRLFLIRDPGGRAGGRASSTT